MLKKYGWIVTDDKKGLNVITRPSDSPGRLISKIDEVFEAWWCTTTRLSRTLTASCNLRKKCNLALSVI